MTDREAMRERLCDECETVAHCTKHGCIPKQSVKSVRVEREAILKLVRTYVSNKSLEEAIEAQLFDDRQPK